MIQLLQSNAADLQEEFRTLSFGFFLRGDLGVGKSSFVKALLGSLGAKRYLGSPTYPIVLEYVDVPGSAHHMDLYRIKSQEELYERGILDLIESSDGHLFLEWPERLEELLGSPKAFNVGKSSQRVWISIDWEQPGRIRVSIDSR